MMRPLKRGDIRGAPGIRLYQLHPVVIRAKLANHGALNR